MRWPRSLAQVEFSLSRGLLLQCCINCLDVASTIMNTFIHQMAVKNRQYVKQTDKQRQTKSNTIYIQLTYTNRHIQLKRRPYKKHFSVRHCPTILHAFIHRFKYTTVISLILTWPKLCGHTKWIRTRKRQLTIHSIRITDSKEKAFTSKNANAPRQAQLAHYFTLFAVGTSH